MLNAVQIGVWGRVRVCVKPQFHAEEGLSLCWVGALESQTHGECGTLECAVRN